MIPLHTARPRRPSACRWRTLLRPALAAAIALASTALVPGLTAQQVEIAPPATSLETSGGVVVSEDHRASAVGARVLAAGGTAVDAAIATGFALAVVHPSAGNIGGGGFMVIRFPDGATTALDFREKAPLGAHPRIWLDAAGEYSSERHHDSHLAVGVPGTVAGFDKAHRLYGTVRWERLVEPAVTLAKEGFEVHEGLARGLRRLVEGTPHEATRAAFTRDGALLEAGDTLRQPDLAASLRRILEDRAEGFYHGETARLIVAEMERGGGLITATDLARYRARERAPVTGSYRGYEIISMPPPSSGGVTLVSMLNILEGFDLAGMGHNSAPYAHLLAEVMRRAFADRARYLADPDFVDLPVHALTAKARADSVRATIDFTRATPSELGDLAGPPESPETTHYSVVDASGMAVSVTYTLEQGYGSGIVVPGAGFLLNNEMGDFNAAPGLTDERGLIGTPPNLARPEQRMLSSMTPSIVARDGHLVAVVGSPGGRTIINTVLQVILNRIDHGMSPEEAVRARRLHHQWFPDRISVESEGVTEGTLERLRAMGHILRVGGNQGLAHSIFIDAATGRRIGVPDARNPNSGAAGH
ncbi:MAG: gamma-glutamyltransferase [Longimicrobiales bacterium]|nr:gamma-glutamyltransferase [Longimicrobiales bacterium]